MKTLRTALTGGSLLLAACASAPAPEPHDGVAERWGRFLSLPHQRSFALAGDPDGFWVGAAVGGYRSRIEAEQEALRRCEHERTGTEILLPCRIYATGHRILWPGAGE